MFYRDFIESLKKVGYSIHEGIDEYVLVYENKLKKDHELNGVMVRLYNSGEAVKFLFKKVIPEEVQISGYSNSSKDLRTRYISFVNLIKLIKKKHYKV